VLVIGLFGVATRGGIQLIPLGVLGASAYAEPAYMPVVLNTPFTIIKSIGKPVLEERVFMTTPEADRSWPVHHDLRNGANPGLLTLAPGQRPNVVVIILESFSAAYSQHLSGQAPGYMPFLDSLMANGLCFTQAYANGRRSIDGVPAILAAIPKLGEDAFIASPYATAPFTSLATVLGKEGYATSFFHGGRNGTMGFDTFTRSAGYDRYVGRDEYPLEGDDDGSWGIRDRPFLQFYAGELARMPQPFHSVLFTLSSHHPYRLAPDDAQRFTGGSMPIHPTLRYADDALRAFFRTARTMPWFSNTLFVITADHTADLERNGQLSGSAFDLWIPLVYYMPGRLAPMQMSRTTQQIDILPTTLDLIGHQAPFFSFGSSALRNTRLASAVSEGNATWMIVTDSVQLRSDGDRVLWVGPAPGLKDPGTAAVDTANRTLQAAIQQFHAHLLKRDMVAVK
jgi:phosphoglycerol transferase MdoB-like AlkP superfamily enzyme